MRKIKSMADVEKVQRRNNIILGVVMIFLLTASSLGYSLMSADSDKKDVVNEEGFEFVRDGGMWKLAIGDEIFGFRYLPSEVVDVDFSANLGQYDGQPLYFVNPGEGVNEILSNIGGYLLRYQEACLDSGINESEVVCKENLPVKDCASNLIVFENGNETKVYSEGNCVFIEGDVVMGADAFLYKLLGVK